MSTSDLERRYPPIADYALLSDCHSAALVSRDGSIDWCCFHRFDASPVFARLLDRDRGGYFQVAPRDRYSVTRRYLDGTNIVETRFETSEGGVLVLTDFLAVQEDTTQHPLHQLLRIVRCERGAVRVGFDFIPRFDYGRTIPRYEPLAVDLGVVYGGADALVLQSDIPIVQKGVCSAEGDAEMREGDEAFLALTYSLPHELKPERLTTEVVKERLATTCRFWTDWSARCTYEGPYREHVVRSALVLKALTNTPTGAIVAAPTTSLPEEVGGSRNWDYRYAWLRDGALNLYALFTLGYTEEAHAFMSWIERTTAGRAEDLQIMYGVGGERFLPEEELDLDGYEGSKPVRIGNAAVEQFQLDVYGYLLDTAWLFHKHGGTITESFWSLLSGIVDVVGKRWVQPDDGIWEVRGGPRHFVSSKVFAWVAVDRAIRLAEATGLPADVAAWRTLRADIKARVLRDGTDGPTGAFVRSFGEQALDASTLMIPLVRFLPASDERVRATMKRIGDELAPDGLVYRYLDRDDGLSGGEGTFVICSFWLVDNLALAGDLDGAQELFERLLTFENDVGLLSEEIDPRTGELLGNFPQAFSHAGLIGAALNLARATDDSSSSSD